MGGYVSTSSIKRKLRLGDFNRNGQVDAADLLQMMPYLRSSSIVSDATYDLDADGIVDMDDLFLFSLNWEFPKP